MTKINQLIEIIEKILKNSKKDKKIIRSRIDKLEKSLFSQKSVNIINDCIHEQNELLNRLQKGRGTNLPCN